MKKILVFGTSNSSQSINKSFAIWAASLLEDFELNIIDLNDFEMPLFGVDRQKRDGVPSKATRFVETIASADALIISLAEHNGSYTTAFKNIVDWSTRVEKSIWQNKPIFLLSTAPGPRGGKSVMASAMASFPHWGGNIIASYSLPLFPKTFNTENGIVDASLNNAFQSALQQFKNAI